MAVQKESLTTRSARQKTRLHSKRQEPADDLRCNPLASAAELSTAIHSAVCRLASTFYIDVQLNSEMAFSGSRTIS